MSNEEVLDRYFATLSPEESQSYSQAISTVFLPSESSNTLDEEVKLLPMKVDTVAYIGNDKRTWTYPRLEISENKALLLKLKFLPVEEHPGVPKNFHIIKNLPLIPTAGADEDKIVNTYMLAKKWLTILLGIDEIVLNGFWIEENLLPAFKTKNGKYELFRDHKLKQIVNATIVQKKWKGKLQYEIESISPV